MVTFKGGRTTTTNANGFYQFVINDDYFTFDGVMEFVVEVEAENSQYNIEGHNDFIGTAPDDIKTNIINLPKNTNLTLTNDVRVAATHKLVHFAGKAWRFCEEQGISLEKGLVIRTFIQDDEAFFLPDSYCGIPIKKLFLGGAWFLPTRPNICIGSESHNNENTIYHEFGHFVMWQLQNKCWIDPIKGSYADHWLTRESNAKISWTEGFASGFGMIVDAFYHTDDNESGTDEDGTDYENRVNIADINNGTHSEYYVITTLYDLWDNNTLGRGAINSDNNREVVSLSFKTLVEPFSQFGLIQNVGDYFRRLMNVSSIKDDCRLKSQISSLFRFNRVLGDIDVFNNELIPATEDIRYLVSSQYGLASGLMGVDVTYENDGVGHIQRLTFNGELERDVDVLGANQKITDPIFLGETTTELIFRAEESQAETCTCGDANIDLFGQDAHLIIGSTIDRQLRLKIADGTFLAARRQSEITIRSGSELVIQKGGTLLIRSDSKLNIEQGGRLVVENGAYLCIESKSALNASNLNQVILGNYQLGVNPVIPTTRLTSNACQRIEDLFKTTYPVTFSQTNVTNCVTGEVNFKLTGWDKLPQDAIVHWEAPSEWKMNANPNNVRWVEYIGGSLNNWGNDKLYGGRIVLTIASSQGIQQIPVDVADLPRPTLTRTSLYEITVCQGATNQFVGVKVSGGNSANYTFEWKNQWNLNFTQSNTSTETRLVLGSSQWTQAQQEVSVIATDTRGCQSNPTYFKVNPDSQAGWRDDQMNTGTASSIGALGATVRTANMVTDSKGNLYYTSENNQIATYTYKTYQYEGITYGNWHNYVLPENAPISSKGPLYLFEKKIDNKNHRTIYYISNEDNRIHSISSIDDYAPWVENGYFFNDQITDISNFVMYVRENALGEKEVYYTEEDKLLRNGGIFLYEVQSKGLAFYQDKLFFRTANGKLRGFNMNTQTAVEITNLDGVSLLNKTNLLSDEKGHVWFTSTDGLMRYYDVLQNKFETVWNTYNPEGIFSINKKTGVLYAYDRGSKWKLTNPEVFQVYFDANANQWKKRDIRNAYSQFATNPIYNLHFSNPNVFYISKDSKIWDIYYFVEGCQTTIYRTDNEFPEIKKEDLEKGLNNGYPSFQSSTEMQELLVYPNPAKEQLTIQYEVSEKSTAKFVLMNLLGQIVKEWTIENPAQGNYETMISLDEMVSGVYLIEYQENAILKARTKLIVE